MTPENFDFLKWLATLFGPAGFVLAITNCATAWFLYKCFHWHRDALHKADEKAKAERDERLHAMQAERAAWGNRIEGFRQDIKDAFQNVNGVSRDMADALGRVVDVVTDLRITVAETGASKSRGGR